MPIIKSAKKRVKTAAKANVRNAKTKRTLRDSLKAFAKALSAGKPEQIAKAQRDAVSAIDQAAKKNVIHKNKAARQKAQLSAKAKSAGAKVTTLAKSSKPKAKSPTAKSVVKKVAPKKPSPTKVSVKLSAGKAKKPVPKKASSKK